MGLGGLGEDDDAAGAAVEAVDGEELAGVMVFQELRQAAPARLGDGHDPLGLVDGEVIVRLEEYRNGDMYPGYVSPFGRGTGHFFLKGFLSRRSRAWACSSAVSGRRSGMGSMVRTVSRALRASSTRSSER